MVIWTPKSEDNLNEIREHTASNFNVDLAVDILNQLINYVETTLGQNHLAGSIVESIFFEVNT